MKEKYVHAKSVYSFGWSHGKEKLEGKPDIAKGSFYFNPIHDRPVRACVCCVRAVCGWRRTR